MIFSVPWAWLGLLAVPALAAIYLLRRRVRRRTVSSLLLWRGAPRRHEGGRRLERFEAPLAFWLELAVLLLLVAAAAGPAVPTPESRRPLVVVLDDSFSMLAADAAPRTAARQALDDELATGRHSTVTLVLAGERPRLLGSGPLEPARVPGALAGWRATAPAASLAEAASYARELGGPRARILVLTDQPPDAEIGEPQLSWRAFGRPLANLAVVQAVRARTEGEEEGSCLLEVANLSSRPATARLRIRVGDAERPAVRSIALEANGRDRVRFRVPAGQAVRAALEADALTIDDTAVLLPETAPRVRVTNAVRDPALARLVDETLAATGRARTVAEGADLVVADGDAEVAGEAWTARIVAEPGARLYLGPFVLDRDHPLTEGLSLRGVVWAAAPRAAEDLPVVSAGDVPLVVDREREGGAHDVVVRLDADLSTVQRTPDWPILWWNLLEWRASAAPGLRRRNARLGETVTLTVARGVEAVDWRPPEGGESRLPAIAGRVEVGAEEPGVHELGGERFAVNALAPGESDLRRAAGGSWGGWSDPGDASWGYRPLGWLFLLLALTLATVHLRWTSRPWRAR